MPEKMKVEVESRSEKDKMIFILSGFNGASFQKDWFPLYDAVVEFCHYMYQERNIVNLPF